MSTLAVLIVLYSFVGLLALRPLAGHFAWMMHRNSFKNRKHPDGEQWFGAEDVPTVVELRRRPG